MEVSTRKEELHNRSGMISPLSFNGFDYLWILNTSCENCFIKITCLKLSLYTYHSIVFSHHTNPILQDATFKNYSICPDQFISRTDHKGFYFVYYYHYHYTPFQDAFNFSYFTFNCEDNYRDLNKNDMEICYCLFQNQSNFCQFHNNITYNFWKKQEFDLLFPRYMHAVSVVRSTIYVHGGISSEDINDRVFIKYSNKNKWEKVLVNSKVKPPCLYAHSMDYNKHNHELVLYGGIVCGSSSTENRNGTVWAFNLTSYSWSSHGDGSNSRSVIGHTIHTYQNTMYSFFGLNGSWNLLSVVQKFDLQTRQWKKSIPFDLEHGRVYGIIYHSTNKRDSKIWMYGGLYVNKNRGIQVSNKLYVFNLNTETWMLISQNGPQLYLQSSVITNNKLLIFGGIILDKNSNNQSLTRISNAIYQFHTSGLYWMTDDNRNQRGSFGGRPVMVNNSAIILIGGKMSSYNVPILEITFDTYFSNISKLKAVEIYSQNIVGPFYPQNCSQLNCETCVRNMCTWCSLTKRCISRIELSFSYIIGACDSPILYENQCPVKCEDLSNSGCHNCTKFQFCGWCEFRNKFIGIGKCVDGNIYGPDDTNTSGNTQVIRHCQKSNFQQKSNWSFLPSRCPACNCNGHATCTNNNAQKYFPLSLSLSKCSACSHNTTGDQCQYCKSGYQGSAINGNNCSLCKCLLESTARQCHSNGFCDEFCIEKGRIGKYCNECDTQNNFTRFHDMCVYNCKINNKYKLNDKTDFFNSYINQVRFLLSDINSNIDLGFQIRCINSQKTIFKVELFNKSGTSRTLIQERSCLFFERNFPKSLFEGKIPYHLLFTVKGFQNSPVDQFQLEIVFTQKAFTNWPFIFISLFACLLTALLFSYTVYKMRQHIRQRDHNYHTLFVMERPFAKINLKLGSDLEKVNDQEEINALLGSNEENDYCQLMNEDSCPLVCVEPIVVKDNKVSTSSDEIKRNSVTAVITFLFQTPKCSLSSVNLQHSQDFHYKHPSRILIGSTLSRLAKKDRKLLLELPTKSSSGNNLVVERDFDTSISPSAADELLVTNV